MSNEATPSAPGPVDDNPYVIEGTLGGIPMDPPPTPPDRYLHTVAGELLAPPRSENFGPINACFAYEIGEPPRTAYRGINTAGVYCWGDAEDSALAVPPGETVSVTQYVIAYIEFPLTCDAGGPYVVECQGHVTPVPLDGTRSANSTGEGLDFLWSSADPSVVFDDQAAERPTAWVDALGEHEVGLLAYRGAFATACETRVEVVDTTPPEIFAVATSPTTLWQPNHRLVPVAVTLEARDACDEDVRVRLLEVRSNEPDDARGVGDGETTGDIQSAEIGTDDRLVLLRAERDGRGSGRTYTLVYELSDTSGNSVQVPVEVLVPHDRRPTRRR